MVADQPPRPANMLHIVAVNQGRAPYTMELAIPPTVSLAEADAALAGGAVAIDVRDFRTFGEEHADGTLNVPLASASFEQHVGWLLPTGGDAVLFVERESQGAEAARRLAFVGLDRRVTGVLPYSTWVDAGRPTASVPQLSPRDAHRRMDGGGLTLVDVRPAIEWRESHVPGATHADFRLFGERADPLPLPRDAEVAVICAGGLRSSIGASLLRRAGFARVYNVSGGMGAWRDAGLPTGPERS